MLPAQLKELIGRLDAGSFTGFVEGLLGAEAARVGLPGANLVMSDAINENDGGLDGLLTGVPRPADGSSYLPEGLVGIQLKATRSKNPAAFKLAEELRKPGPSRVLREGGTYVLVSSQDLNPAQRTALETALNQEAADVLKELAVTSSPRVAVWDAQTLALLTAVHPGPAIDIGLIDFERALTMQELLQVLRADEQPFQLDDARTAVIARVRERAAGNAEDPLILMLHGDAGAGKTRTVAEALNAEELRDSVIYINGAEDLGRITTRVLRNRQSYGIIFVDEAEDGDVTSASHRLGATRGRWRIVSVQTRGDRAWLPEGARNAVLPPLNNEATRRLVENLGLPDLLARRVAEVAAGFPALALRLADELRADPELDLVRLAHLPSPAALLKRALPDDNLRKHLAPIALFSRVGFEAELGYELEAVATEFGLDADTLRRICDVELPRGFVSRAGRYRMVSPKLVAVWLATDLIARTTRFDEHILALPEALQDAFVRQLEYFGPDSPHLPEALRHILADGRFRRPEAFTEAAARLLRASAAIVPEQAAAAIGSLLREATPQELITLPRRDLVWALQVLLWWHQTWEAAASSLFTLATHETETWANNASAVFIDAFSIYLAGTLVPYADRASWLAERIQSEEGPALELLARAAASGLKAHHMRTVVGFAGGGEPRDWRPDSPAQHVEARRTAWNLLITARDRAQPSDAGRLTTIIAQSLRSAYTEIPDDIERAIASRTWSADEQVALASAIRGVLRYDEPPPDAAARLHSMHDVLMGRELGDRLETILRTPVWELDTGDRQANETPVLLTDLADEVVHQGSDSLNTAMSVGRDLEDQGTRFALLRAIAMRLGATRLGDRALEARDWTALAAAISVADQTAQGGWATAILTRLSTEDPSRVPALLTYLDLDRRRLDIALGVVERGDAQAGELGRLLYGARVRALGEADAMRLIRVVCSGGAFEPGLGMLQQWVEAHQPPSGQVRSLASELAVQAIQSASGSRIEYDIEVLVRADAIDGQALRMLVEKRLENGPTARDQLDMVLVARVFASGGDVARWTYELVRRLGYRAVLGADALALLSRLAAATSAESVWTELSEWSEHDLRFALHHMRWDGQEPDPLVRQFLASSRLHGLEDEAAVCFSNTLGVVIGPYHLAVEREIERAQSWRDALQGTTGASWADTLVAHERASVEWHRQHEAEVDALLQ